MIKGKNVFLTPILKQISFELKQGRITTFMGQSGAGKTTLLQCIANLRAHYQGSITYQGQDLKDLHPIERASSIGFVQQQFNLFPHLTVLQNCTFALKAVLQLTNEESIARSFEALEALSIRAFSDALPGRLSGGQQQRAAIARALVLRPKVILFDEPTSALDPDSKKGFISILNHLKEQGITIALSSHDMPFIKQIMDYIYFLENGELVEAWDSRNDAMTEKIHQFITH